jgi:hypothetical protein
MRKYQINPISRIFYQISGTGVILILAVLIDWWLFKLLGNHKNVIYYLGLISFIAIFAGFIVNIWRGFGKNQE